MKKIIALLLLSTILLSGCTNSTSAVNKSATSKTSATTSANNTASNSSVSKDSQKASNTVSTTASTANSAITSANAKKAPLSSADKTKVDNNIKPIITSIDSALNSLDEEKDITIN